MSGGAFDVDKKIHFHMQIAMSINEGSEPTATTSSIVEAYQQSYKRK
jgi:hypothetical protein